jgi:hypothetical protein
LKGIISSGSAVEGGARVPDAVPFLVRLPLGGDQAVDAGAQRVDLEVERVLVVEEGVEEDLDVVVDRQVGVARHCRGDDRARLGIEALDADVEVVVVEHQQHARRLARSVCSRGSLCFKGPMSSAACQ